MLQTNRLEIYPTSRAARERVKQDLSTDGFLPTITTIGEFEKKAILVKNRTFIDQDRRTLLLNDASSFSNFKDLHIPREFFTFLKNSKFLFGFFDELSVELIDIMSLKEFDTYASYHEHLEILETLLNRYIFLINENNYVDKITLPSLYTLNKSYLKSFDKIEFVLEGYLNNFEFKLFQEIAEVVPLIIEININKFNQKMADKFKELDIDLSINNTYKIDLSNTKIIKQTPSLKSNTKYQITPCNTKVTQVAFIKKKIYDYVNDGILPKNIAIILPDSNFVDFVDLFDDKNNLNFAMGFSFTKTFIYKKLSALYDYYSTKDHENKHRLKKFGFMIEEVDDKQKHWNKRFNTEKLKEFFASFVEINEDEPNMIYHQELHIFSKLFPALSNEPLHKVFHLFLNRLKEKSLDDSRGGKVTVLEILETRGVSFEGLILVDFNEGKVPKISQKDLFLSDELRYFSSLPTSSDRQNLQKQYYKSVFEKAKQVSISYADQGTSRPSRFLDELGISDFVKPTASLDSILFEKQEPKVHYQKDDLILDYDFSKTKVSATSLKCFLDCKRSYYFKYIKKLEHAEIPKDDNSDRIIGILLHNALKEAYQDRTYFNDAKDLKFEVQSKLYHNSQHDPNLRFLVDIWLKKLNPFFKNEIERAKDGYKIKEVEKSFTLVLDNLTLTGQIDRIDQHQNYLEVIDYKSGKIPKDSKKNMDDISNFQLQFYHLLVSKQSQVKQSYYYDLNSGELVIDALFDEKLDILYKRLEELDAKQFNFTKTDNLKKCEYCPYINICDRLM